MISMPPAQYCQANGIRMAYYEAGPRSDVPVIYCHGFPELAFSWRHQLKAMEAAGRWAIAPDQRGYGRTARPASITDYDMEHLSGDLIGLLDHLGVEKAIWCGHDWGGILTWQMPLLYPERTAGVIGLNTPFMPRRSIDPIAFFRKTFGDQMYIVHFQEPGIADAILEADVEKTMRYFMRLPPGVGDHFSRPRTGSRTGFALVNAIAAYEPDKDRRGEFLTEEELSEFVEAFRETGFTGGINWYRNFTRNWLAAEGRPQHIPQPALMIMAELDAVLSPAMAEGMEAFVPDLEKVLIKDCGHWSQQEKPAEVNAAILGWLDKRFPASL